MSDLRTRHSRVEAIHAQKTSLLDNTIEKIRQLNDRISECEARHVDTDCGHADAYDTTVGFFRGSDIVG